uniref:Putative tick kunitz 48 n=1 Tax=Amblyomma triste TaxID=251400 RepID=A0A023G649_AMBTT
MNGCNLTIFMACAVVCYARLADPKYPRCFSRPRQRFLVNPKSCYQNIRYFFHLKTRQCVPYCINTGGFKFQTACDFTCRSVNVCRARRPKSTCNFSPYIVFFYDPSIGRCLPDTSCTRKGNNFLRREECEETCKNINEESNSGQR